MATNRFNIFDANGNSVSFSIEEATDTDTTKGSFSIDIASDLTAGGEIKMQIRPGKRYKESFEMILAESKYIDFINLLTNNSNDYFIEYTFIPSVLDNDPKILVKNFFEVSIQLGNITKNTGVDEANYHFPFTISMVALL